MQYNGVSYHICQLNGKAVYHKVKAVKVIVWCVSVGNKSSLPADCYWSLSQRSSRSSAHVGHAVERTWMKQSCSSSATELGTFKYDVISDVLS